MYTYSSNVLRFYHKIFTGCLSIRFNTSYSLPTHNPDHPAGGAAVVVHLYRFVVDNINTRTRVYIEIILRLLVSSINLFYRVG